MLPSARCCSRRYNLVHAGLLPVSVADVPAHGSASHACVVLRRALKACRVGETGGLLARGVLYGRKTRVRRPPSAARVPMSGWSVGVAAYLAAGHHDGLGLYLGGRRQLLVQKKVASTLCPKRLAGIVTCTAGLPVRPTVRGHEPVARAEVSR